MFSSLILTVDGIVIASNKIKGQAKISRREGEASTLEITIKTGSGVQNVDSFSGKNISLVIDGVTAFVGVVDMPKIDLILKQYTLFCTDKRLEILNAQTFNAVGFYSSAIFQEVENAIDELNQRLTTIPSVADILPSGSYVITDINPKAVEDITLSNSDVYRKTPKVSPTSRGALTNQVNLTFKSRFKRLRHRERDYQISDNTFCEYINDSNSRPSTKESYYSFIDAIDWHVNEQSIAFTPFPLSGFYNCGFADFIWYNLIDYWQLSVAFKAAKRFAQTITEEYSISVIAPQSISQYGAIEWNQENGIDEKYDYTLWESEKTYKPPTGLTADVNDYYIDMDDSVLFNEAIICSINIAKTKIIKSHRDTKVNFETDLRLDFDLTKTIKLNTTVVSATGKTTAINHIIDMTNKRGITSTEISLSTAQGAQVDDPIIAPARPLLPVVADPFVQPHLIPIDLYGVGTIVSQDIDGTSRNEQIVTALSTYNIEIKNNNFVVTF